MLVLLVSDDKFVFFVFFVDFLVTLYSADVFVVSEEGNSMQGMHLLRFFLSLVCGEANIMLFLKQLI